MPTLPATGYAVPRSPSVDPLAAAPEAYQQIPAPAGAFGAGTATALSGLGTSLEKAAGALENIQDRYDKAAADEQINARMGRINKRRYGDPDDPTDVGWHGLADRAAMDAYKPYTQSLQTEYDEGRANLTPVQRQRYDERMRPFLQHAMSEAGLHYANSVRGFRTKELDSSIKVTSGNLQTAAAEGNQTAFAEYADQQAKLVDDSPDLTPAQKDEHKQRLRKENAKDWATGMIARGDYDGAERFINGNKGALGDYWQSLTEQLKPHREKAEAARRTGEILGTGGGGPTHLNYGATGALGDPREPGWAEKNLTTVTSPSGVKLQVHKQAANDIGGFVNELEGLGYKLNPKTSGGHVVRNITGGNTLSEHAYGTAIDLNSDVNLYTKDGRLVTDLPKNVGELAAKYNLEWGGNWKDPVDAMHFQWRPPGTRTAAAPARGDAPAPDTVDNWETRNNNFGGIRKPGATGTTAEGGFQSFATPEAGVSAIADNLRRYAAGGVVTAMNPEGKPLNTIRGIVTTWAPPNENDTAKLIAQASKTTGYGPDQVLDLNDPAVMGKMLEATIRNEQGGKLPVSPSVISRVAAGKGGSVATNGSSTPPGAPAPAPGRPKAADLDANLAEVQRQVAAGTMSPEVAEKVETQLRHAHSLWTVQTAAERSALDKEYKDGIAALADGKEWVVPVDRIRRLLPADKAAELLEVADDARTAGGFISTVRTSAPEDIAAQRAQLAAGTDDPTANNYARRSRLLKIHDDVVKHHQTELNKDPAKYVGAYSPDVAGKQQAYAQLSEQARAAAGTPMHGRLEDQARFAFDAYAHATLQEQARLGVPEQKRAILGEDQAANIAAGITRIDPAQTDPAQAISALARSYGSGQGAVDHWPQVFGELVKAKLPGAYQVLGAMDRPDQKVAASDLSRALGFISQKGGLATVKANAGEDRKNIDKELTSALEEFRLSTGPQPQGENLYRTVEEAAQALAYYYAYRGESANKAANHAVDGILNAKYGYGTFGPNTVRVPKQGDRDMVGTTQRAADRIVADIASRPEQLPAFPGGEYITAAQNRALWLEAVKNGGWANNGDDSGIVLMAQLRNGGMVPVRRADGTVVSLKFSDASAIAETPSETIPGAAIGQLGQVNWPWQRGRSAAPVGVAGSP